MTVKELEKRLTALEHVVNELQSRVNNGNGIAHQEAEDPAKQRHWWRDNAGTFKDDPIFDEIVRLGREYRQSLHPDYKKRQKKNRSLTKKNARP